MAKQEKPHWQVLHEQAVAEGKMCYLDPELGYSVFTASHHLDRGFCCESGCRHCPYGFIPRLPAAKSDGSQHFLGKDLLATGLSGKTPVRKKEGAEE